MQKQITAKSSRCFPKLLYPLLLVTLLRVIIISSNISYPTYFSFIRSTAREDIVLPFALQTQVSHIQNQLGVLLRQLHTENTELTSVVKFADQVLGIAVSVDKLADKLWHLYGDLPTSQNYTSKLDEELGESEEGEVEEGSMGERVFDSEELCNYTAPKPNRLSGKKNFLGVEALYPSIGLPCIGVASSIDHYRTYKTNGVCPDDWVVAQKLIVGGCDPLPRRRCFSRSPQRYSKPLPINSSLWITPGGTNILWTHYKCKDYSCLISNQTVGRRGFFKCSDCFNLSKRGWEVPSNVTASAEFTINEFLSFLTSP